MAEFGFLAAGTGAGCGQAIAGAFGHQGVLDRNLGCKCGVSKRVGIDYPRVRRTSNGWALTFLAAILLCAVGPVGFVAMLLLQDAADRKTLAACKIDPTTAHYSKGFPFALPVGVLAVVFLGIVLLCALFVFGRGQERGWMKAVGACMVSASLLSALFVGTIASEYHDYPGSDITSAMGEPCGSG